MVRENTPVYSVTELVQTARALLEAKFPMVLVQGEIGRFTKHPSGHMYFDLKDEKCLVSCAFFKGSNHNLTFQPAMGQKVIVTGTLTLFEARGQFQLNVRGMEPAGLGALQLAFEQLKQKLMAEGLFEADRKKPVPEHPHRIALITSPSGAAIQDFMKILETRVGIDEVELFPVKVQGLEAPAEIIEAIGEVSRRKKHDVLVLTRGGGSLEDLAAFNDEGVVRALADCAVPTVCAVGHEVDFSLCDFVADRREPTPTAAAAHLAPGIDETRDQLDSLTHRLTEALENLLEGKRRDLEGLLTSLQDRRPNLLLDQARQSLDFQSEKLRAGLETLMKDRAAELERLTGFLARTTPLQRLKPLRARLDGLEAQLKAYHPHGPLKRGYAIVTNKKTGKILRSPDEVKKGERLVIEVQKGKLESQVVSADNAGNQESLF
ncbi:MAG TPA: exodeoxyribonuclease VII large subunit [bacterium]|nr:exodeoxyribonuclease VII large subunit [bacterium]